MAVVAAALALGPLGSGAAHAETPAERAWRNYELLHSGAKKPSDLSDVERRELAALLQLMREDRNADRRTPRQRCIDEEVEREGGNPSDLAMRVIDLKCSQR
ncbi:hypothetical protein E5675_09245 [Sphingopyxis sp. PAMC25046]|uniref:hypothetical protein n=1 Tax=Sphingopyxis sp. PAMC25046 TaxID=2565556 RepID=UPI00109DFECB|nr:hypothetical protein [Sphingopyxis sp. PAMC25046]QCB54605.1 hypothetical protein E5675_09245 [Sphingopyxis sp. PAMC25046]